MPDRSTLHRFGWPLLALCAGLALVGTYDRTVAPARYAYSADSASYIEMADSMRRGQFPSVVPWGTELAAQERVAQPLFPPGFPLLAAIAAPWAGGARQAVGMLPRWCAALLPLLLLVSFRRLLDDAVLLAIGVGLLGTQGILYWHYVGYSDLPGLCLAVVALGTCWRSRERLSRGLPARAVAVSSGVLTGLSYGVRNAGLAVIAAGVVFWLLESWRDRAVRRTALAWLAGLAPVVGCVKLYNLVAFGMLAPYSMPASTRGWVRNLADWVGGQVMDLQLLAPDAHPLSWQVALAVLLPVLGLAALAVWFVRRQPAAGAVRLLLLYAGAGGLLVIASRSRYEWGGIIDSRHALQYTFALLLVLAIALDALLRGVARRIAVVAAWIGVGLLGWSALDTALTEAQQAEDLRVLADDSALVGAVRALPAQTWLVSNDAMLWRIELGRDARQSDFGGDEAELASYLGELQARVRPRPLAFVLICNEWTARLAGCAGPASSAMDPRCRQLRVAYPRALLCVEPGAVSPRASG